MRIHEPRQLRLQLLDALLAGPAARVDRGYTEPDGTALLCLVGADRTVYWIVAHPDLRTHLHSVTRIGHGRELVYGAGCDSHGFRLLGAQPAMVAALIRRCLTPPALVRGSAADFPLAAVA